MDGTDSGKSPKVVATHVIALYRPGDGRVMHLHTVRVFEGGRSVSKEDAEKEALTHATRLGHDVKALKSAYMTELPEGHGDLHFDAPTNTLKHTEPTQIRSRGRRR